MGYMIIIADADDFEITEVGELRIAAGKVLNYTEVATYSLTITASDGGVPAMTASVTATGSVVTGNRSQLLTRFKWSISIVLTKHNI